MKNVLSNQSTVNQYVKVHDNGANWLVGAPWRDLVVNQDGLNWFELSNDSNAVLIKEGQGRQMWRVIVGNESFYAKIFHDQTMIERTIGLMGRGKAAREWHVLIQASGCDLATPIPVALGAGGTDRSIRVLLTKEIRGAEPLSQIWQNVHGAAPKATNRSRKIAIIRATATLFANAHHAGFFHRDAHPGNIVVCSEASGSYRAWYVDVHGSKFQGGALTVAQAALSLAQLDQYFHRKASHTDRLRFLIRYLENRDIQSQVSGSDKPRRDYVHAVSLARTAHANRLAKQRDRRLLRDGKYFGVVQYAGGWRGCVVKKLSRRHVFPEPDIPDRTAMHWRDIIEILTTRLSLAGTLNTAFELDGLTVEWQQPKDIMERLNWSIWGSPYRKAFYNSHRKRHRDVNCHLVLGYLEHRSAGLIDTAAIIRPGPTRQG